MNKALAAVVLAAGGPLLALCACDESKKNADSARPDASAADKYAAADPRLAKALASASTAAEHGPPPEGIFAPGIADQRHPKGAPTKIEMTSDGAEPHVSLAPDADASADARATSFGPAQAEVGMRLQAGQNAMALPTTDLQLALGPGGKDEGGADVLFAPVKKAGLAREQAGQLPPGADKQVATLEGAEVRMKVSPDGRTGDFTVKSKAVAPELQLVVAKVAEALALSTVPLPPKPVGVGAQWIAESRMSVSQFDVVAYRAYRVKNIQNDRLSISLDVRAYAASHDLALDILPKGSSLEQFDAQAHGEMELVRGEILARKSNVQQRVVVVFEPPGQASAAQGQPPQSAVLQMQSETTMLRGDDLRTAASSRK